MIKIIIRAIKPSLCYTTNSKFNKQRLQVKAWISLHTSYVHMAHRKILTIVNMQWIQFFIELIFQIISTWVSSEQIFCIKIDVWVQICNKGSFRMYLRHIPCARRYPLWPSDAIWRQRSGSTLAQVVAWCLTAPSHYLNQCWLISTPNYIGRMPSPILELNLREITRLSNWKKHIKLQWNWHEIPLLDYANNLQIFYPFWVELCAVS